MALPSLDTYFPDLEPTQRACIDAIRGAIHAAKPDVVESIDQGRMLRGMLVFSTPEGMFLFALGPRKGGLTSFHALTYYGSKELQQKYGQELKPFLTGKSCMEFKSADQIPTNAIDAIVGCDVAELVAAWKKRR